MKCGCRRSDLKMCRHEPALHYTYKHKHTYIDIYLSIRFIRLLVGSISRLNSTILIQFDFQLPATFCSSSCVLIEISSVPMFLYIHTYIAYICRSTFKFQCDVNFFISFKNHHYYRCLFKELKTCSLKRNEKPRQKKK